jgi:ornithine cyclodeaminase/alanine dehydrogenase-like protein (mu-crystallin family)
VRVLDALAAERAYAASATGAALPDIAPALAGAVASHHLAVAAPRSFSIVGAGDDAAASLAAHRTWFAPRDIRCTDAAVAAAVGGRVVSLAEALAADIVCVHVPIVLFPEQLRRGTHVNALAGATLSDELEKSARIAYELASLAAGLVDGRRLDEITIYLRAT